jgi:hypothetical protein
MSWKSPTGYNDPDNAWFDQANAYDGNTTTRATCFAIPPSSWGSFLELLITPTILCDKVRFYASGSNITQVDIDVYYDDNWHDVYQGIFTASQWNEKTISNGPFVILKARVRFYNNAGVNRNAYLYEFAFNQLAVRPLVDGSLASAALIKGGFVR